MNKLLTSCCGAHAGQAGFNTDFHYILYLVFNYQQNMGIKQTDTESLLSVRSLERVGSFTTAIISL